MMCLALHSSLLGLLLLAAWGHALEDVEFFKYIQKAEDRFAENMKRYQMPGVTTFKNKTDVCYDDDIGCFDLQGEFKHTGLLPEAPSRINTSWQVYWRGEHYDKPVNVHYNDPSSFDQAQEAFQRHRKLAILTHGFGGSGRTFWVVHMKDALLTMDDLTVIAVDWRRGSSLPYYDQAACNTVVVARQTAKLLQKLIERFPNALSADDLHFIGFSMGAQVGGFCGRHFEKLTGRKMARLTVLDAAAPGFERYNVHVNNGDAAFVDAVHTSAGASIVTGKVGMVRPVGHVDIYPNGGVSQPGCRLWHVKCHHERAHHYFREAILRGTNNSCHFGAMSCVEDQQTMQRYGKCTKDVAKPASQMGLQTIDHQGRGVMFLPTAAESPFCKS